MDWTLKTPLQWDWETLALFSAKESEIPKPAQQPYWKFDGGHGNKYGNGSVCTSGGGACSVSELGNGSSRTSISAFIGSPSNAGTRTPEFNLGSAEQSPENLKKSKDIARVETGVLHRVVASEDPKEPLIGLKLGKRTYFEDVCEGNNDINSSSLASMNPSIGLVKKPKLSQQNIQSSHCQVEGCNADLTTAKDYHRKHRVCESHSKSPKVLIAGQERRFCQQCSRFHDLSEFDQKKRSCRRRLSDHNARRRKPQPETISFSPSILSSSYYDDRQQTSLIFGRASSAQVMNMANSTWDDSGGFKLIPTKGSWVNSNKSGGINGNLHFPCTGISKNISTVHHDLDRLLSFKGSTTKVLDKGLGAPVIASYLDGASDLQRALSLLSTESGVPSKPELITDFQFVNANTSHSAIHHPNNTTAGIWQQDKLPLPKAPSLLPFDLQSNVSQFQEFQLHKTPYGTLFFDSTQIH